MQSMDSVCGSVPGKAACCSSSISLNSRRHHLYLSGGLLELSDTSQDICRQAAAQPRSVLASVSLPPGPSAAGALMSSAPSVLETSVITVGILSNLGPKIMGWGPRDHT